MTMRTESTEKWQHIRSKGILRFVFFRGVLGWGLGTATLFVLIRWLMGGAGEVPQNLAMWFVIFPSAGIFWGVSMWLFLSYKFRQEQAR